MEVTIVVINGLYEISYVGSTGMGSGKICVANGRFAGFDVGGGNYVGEVDQGSPTGDFKGTLSFPVGGLLVTGQSVPAGASIVISGRFPLSGDTADHSIVTLSGQEGRVRIRLVP